MLTDHIFIKEERILINMGLTTRKKVQGLDKYIEKPRGTPDKEEKKC